MRKITLLLSFSFLYIFNFAQSDFRDGYIIKNDGTKIEGKLDFLTNELSYRSCTFKDRGALKVYKPEDIKGYGFDKEDRYFTSQVIDDIFVEVLIDGYVSFYKHGLKYYVQKENRPLDTIQSILEEKIIKGREFEVDAGGWKDVMKKIASDCNDLKIDNQRYKVNEQKLLRFIKKYHKCVGQDFKEYKQDSKFTQFKPSFAFGISDNTINNKNPTSTFFYVPDKFDKYNGWVGAYLQIGAPRLFENVLVQIGAEFHENTYLDKQIVEFGLNDFYETQIDLKTISIPFQVMYLMDLKNALKLNIQAGLNMDFNDGSSITYEENAIGQEVFYSEYESFKIEETQFGFNIGAGIRYQTNLAAFGLTFTTTRLQKLNREAGLELFNNRNSIILLITL